MLALEVKFELHGQKMVARYGTNGSEYIEVCWDEGDIVFDVLEVPPAMPPTEVMVKALVDAWMCGSRAGASRMAAYVGHFAHFHP